uniref:Terpene synthase n=1 Tax=Laurencia subopposita TaxID=3071698 RepID=A0AA96V0G3_9FLOR|nr:TS-5 [Laurencia subopposita]
MSLANNIAATHSARSDSVEVGFSKLRFTSFVSFGDEFINEHEAPAFIESVAWFQSLNAIATPQHLKIVKNATFERLVSRTFPFADLDGTRVATDLMILTFLLDDLSDVVQATDDGAMHVMSVVEGQVTHVLQGGAPRAGEHPLAVAMRSIVDRAILIGNPAWIELMTKEYITYLEMNRLERINRLDGPGLSWTMFENTRYYSSCVLPFLYLSAAMGCTGCPSSVLSMPFLQIMTNLAVNHVAWVNDIVGANKERKEAVNNNIVFVMANDRGLTMSGAVKEAVKRTNQECEVFLNFEHKLHAGGVVVDADDLLNYIEVLKYWMRGSLDWHFESKRYKVKACK